MALKKFPAGTEVIITDIFFDLLDHYIGREGVLQKDAVIGDKPEWLLIRIHLKKEGSDTMFEEYPRLFTAVKIKRKDPLFENNIRKLRLTCKK